MTDVIIFTDMDGTLLDHHSYSHQAADPLLAELERRSIPVIPTTSKTFAELQSLRRELNNQHPFICENGAAVYLPREYFNGINQQLAHHGDFLVKSFVEPRAHWQALLNDLPAELKTQFTSFGDLGVDGIMALTGLPRSQAEQSAERQFGEPVHWRGSNESRQEFCQQVAARGGNTLVGGRFIHVSGKADKGTAAQWLAQCYARQQQSPLVTLGLGDSGNDVALLAAVDYPIIVRSPVHAPPQLPADMATIEQLVVTTSVAPQGWVEGVTQVLTLLGRN